MEKTVTLRFYDVTRTRADRPALIDILNVIAGLPVDERERHITADEILVRLENFETDGNCVSGQFIRGQTGNRPGRMTAAGTDNLPFEEPIGHGIAFRYRTTDGVLAIEYNPFLLSPSRVFDYIYEFEPQAEFDVTPRMRQDVWDEFNQRPLRKMVVGIAGHPDVANADDPDAATWANLGNMRDAYGAHTVRIEIGMGHTRGQLTEAAKDFLRRAVGKHDAGAGEIRTVRGVLERGEGVPNEEIDLIGELLNVKVDLSFPENNFGQFYVLRRNTLRTRLNLL